MMKDSTMSVADTKEEFMLPQESSPTVDEEQELDEGGPFESMQTELHSRGAELTKAWSNLFSFITKYQAELVVKENSVEIAEKEIEQRKKQLEEMKPVVDAGNEEITQLQDEIRTKERLLSKAQSQLSVKERMLQRVQSDLSCNMEMLEKSRSELLGKQNELIRYRGDLERLKSELTIKQEQIQIKDNLLKKLQNQLMKENAELKEQLELERRALQLEKQSHELTKRTMLSPQHSTRKRARTSEGPAAVIEIPDSPPTLDLSVEGDFGLSNIISLAESQAVERDSSAQTRLSSGRELSRISNTSQSFTDHSSRLRTPTSTTPSQWGFSTPPKVAPSPSKFMASPSITSPQTSLPSIGDNITISDTTTMTSSDTFFPLSVSEDVKPGMDTLTSSMQLDSDSQGNMPILKPGTPSSGTSDSNQGPVPVSGPIASPAMSPGGSTDGGADGKDSDSDVIYPVQGEDMSSSGSESEVFRCDLCDLVVASNRALRVHRRNKHADEELHVYCRACGESFRHVDELARHELEHKEAMKCSLCDKEFDTSFKYRSHIMAHRNQSLNKESYNRRKYNCDTCGKLFETKQSLQQHIDTHSNDKMFICPDCNAVYRTKIGLKCHMGRQCYSRLCTTVRHRVVLQEDECYYCHKLFGTRSLMKEHLATHTDENPEECPICQKMFSGKSNRNKHMNTHVAWIVFRCDTCLRSFRTKDDLEEHIGNEHPDLPEMETVGETAQEPSSSEGDPRNKQTTSITQEDMSDFRPQSTESGMFFGQVGLETSGPNEDDDEMSVPGPSAKNDSVEKQNTFPEITWKIYECDVCRYAFISQKLLDAHRRRHTGEKPYLCSICGKGYQNSGGLSKHMALHPFRKKPKNTTCHICKKRFKSWCFLRDHLCTHTGERPFVCETCGKGFMSKTVLHRHRAAHKKTT